MENLDWGWFLFRFDGRINRGKFWLGVVVLLVAYAIIAGIAAAADSAAVWTIVGVLYIGLIWPSLAISIKRWHDRDKSGRWVLIGLDDVIARRADDRGRLPVAHAGGGDGALCCRNQGGYNGQ